MTDERLLDRNNPPEPELIRQLIGDEAFPLWEQVNQFLQEQYPDFQGGMTYYNAQRGWGQIIAKVQRRVRCFRAGRLDRLSYLPIDGKKQPKIRYQCSPGTLRQSAPALPQTLLWMRLRTIRIW